MMLSQLQQQHNVMCDACIQTSMLGDSRQLMGTSVEGTHTDHQCTHTLKVKTWTTHTLNIRVCLTKYVPAEAAAATCQPRRECAVILANPGQSSLPQSSPSGLTDPEHHSSHCIILFLIPHPVSSLPALFSLTLLQQIWYSSTPHTHSRGQKRCVSDDARVCIPQSPKRKTGRNTLKTDLLSRTSLPSIPWPAHSQGSVWETQLTAYHPYSSTLLLALQLCFSVSHQHFHCSHAWVVFHTLLLSPQRD